MIVFVLHLIGTKIIYSPGNMIKSRRFCLENTEGDRKISVRILNLDKTYD